MKTGKKLKNKIPLKNVSEKKIIKMSKKKTDYKFSQKNIFLKHSFISINQVYHD